MRNNSAACIASALLWVCSSTLVFGEDKSPASSVAKSTEREELHAVDCEVDVTQPETTLPVKSSVCTIDYILRNLHDLDGKVVKIKFVPYNIMQEKDGTYSCNVGAGSKAAVVLIPQAPGKLWFGDPDHFHGPPQMYVRVTSGSVENKYGAKKNGAILKGAGISLHKDVRGATSYRW